MTVDPGYFFQHPSVGAAIRCKTNHSGAISGINPAMEETSPFKRAFSISVSFRAGSVP
jgi:hypothetical protein